MQIWPAIDLRGGRCVRLRQGDFTQETVYGEDPVEMARHWVAEGAQYLHLVDLDGARDGRPANFEAISAIVEALDIPCELGGGIRSEQAIEELLALGLSRLVVGTKALREPKWFAETCHAYPNKLVLGLDARDGQVATDGWLETSDVTAIELAAQFADAPLAAIVYTDIARDGMLAGPNLSEMEAMKRASPIPVVASGGVTTADDVARLAAIGMDGCIIGKAFYEGRLTLAEALAAADGLEINSSSTTDSSSKENDYGPTPDGNYP